MRTRIPTFSILAAVARALPAIIKSIEEATAADSDGGRKMTKDEWIELARTALNELAPEIGSLLFKANR